MQRPRKRLTTLEVCAWGAGLLCASALFAVRLEGMHAQRAAARLTTSTPPLAAAAQAGDTAPSAAPDLSTFEGVIGRLEIPALALQVPILNDYGPDSLRRGVGRMKGTAVPGGLGNLVLAGHRDTYFRPLRHVSKGMLMRVVTRGGTYDYLVDSSSIVEPSDVDVLDIGNRPEMTLITCYPFDFIGAAPKRFIVHTHLVSVGGETK